jgi:hypothetical protein
MSGLPPRPSASSSVAPSAAAPSGAVYAMALHEYYASVNERVRYLPIPMIILWC